MVERLLRKQFHSTAPASLIDWARTEYLKTPLHVRLAEEEALLAVHHTEHLAGLRMPVLLVYGEEEEKEIASQMRVAAELIPDAEIHCIPGASHYPNLERPEAFNSILANFLARIGHG